MMSYEKLYESHFAVCLVRIKEAQEAKGKHLPKIVAGGDPLFAFEDEKFNLSVYEDTVDFALRQTRMQLTRLFYSMLQDQASISLENEYQDPQRDYSLPLYLLSRDNREVIVFCMTSLEPHVIDRFVEQVKPNSIWIVRMNGKPDDVWKQVWREEESGLNDRYACDIRISTLQEFFEKYFSAEEYAVFIEAKDLYLCKAKQLISKAAVDVPTKGTIAEFSQKCRCELIEEADSYRRELLSRAFSESELDCLLPENIDEALLETLFNREMAFSKSYVSGEWFYGVAVLTDQLEKTSAIAGTIKAIEMLLRRIVDPWVRSGREIPIGEIGKGSEKQLVPGALTDKEGKVRKAAAIALKNKKPWGLENFFHLPTNRDLFKESDSLFEEYTKYLGLWRECRNNYFHGGSVFNAEKVESIRRNLHRLLILMIACLDIDSRQLVVGAIEDKSRTESSPEEDFQNWIIQTLDDPRMRLCIVEGGSVLDLLITRRPSSHATIEAGKTPTACWSVFASLLDQPRIDNNPLSEENTRCTGSSDFEWEGVLNIDDLCISMKKLAEEAIERCISESRITVQVSVVVPRSTR